MRVVIFGQALLHEKVTWSDEVRALAADADAVICNFEGCLPPAGAWPMKTKTVHPAGPAALEDLRELGVTHLGIANNHAWDFGHPGILATRNAIVGAGIAVAGAGVDGAEARAPANRNGVALIAVDAGPTPDWAIAGKGPGVAALRVRRVLGLPRTDLDTLSAISEASGDGQRRRLRQAVGFDVPSAPRPLDLDCVEAEARQELHIVDPEDLDRLCRSVEAAAGRADLVIVAIHYHMWAPDWLEAPTWLASVAESALSNGAHAVVGTGPPWAFPAARTGERLVAPGLGNLVFHTGRPARYDELGLPVWRGLAAVHEQGDWTTRAILVQRPHGR